MDVLAGSMAFIFSGPELFDMLFVTVAAGYIFMDVFTPASSGDPIQDWQRQVSFKDRFLYSILLVAPAILLHEFGHKFVGLYFGLDSTLNAAYVWLLIGVVVKLLRFPFIFFVPAYVSIQGASASQLTLIAFAGPAVNLFIAAIAFGVYKVAELSESTSKFWQYTMWINVGLFVLNMLPVPGFDGSKVFSGLLGLF